MPLCIESARSLPSTPVAAWALSLPWPKSEPPFEKSTDAKGPLVQADDPQWYALRVLPQKEYVAAYLLRKQGVRTFVPTETRFLKRTRYAKSSVEFAVPIIPGCVFAGFDGPPAWYDVLKNTLIVGPEGMDGKPWRLDIAKLFAFLGHVVDGCMVIDEGQRLIYVQGKGMIRSLTTRVKSISPRKKINPGQGKVIETKGRRADFLSRFVLGDKL